MRNSTPLQILGGAALASLLACSGGGGSDSSSTPTPSTPATSLSYTNPTPASGQWSLVKDGASTSTHLILNLMPPTDGASGFGVGFTVNAPNGLAWTKVNGADAQLLHNSAVYTLGSGTQLMKSVSKSGDLIVGIYQKGLTTTPALHSAGAVGSIAVDLSSGATTGAATLTVKASQELQASGMHTITIAVGTLALQ